MMRRAFFILALIIGLFGLALAVDASRRGLMMQTPATSGDTNVYRAVRFTGSSFLVVTNSPINNAEITIAIWTTNGVASIQSSLYGWHETASGRRIQAHAPFSGTVYWDVFSTTVGRISFTPAAVLFTNRVHWTFTHSATGNFQRIYTNGVLAASGSGVSSYTSDDTLELGRFLFGSTARYHVGDVEDFAVWDRALSTTEISNLVVHPTFFYPTNLPTNLWGYWIPGLNRTNISSGDAITDWSGNGRTMWGSLTNPIVTNAVLNLP